MSETELKQYMDALRQKTKTYQSLKQTLQQKSKELGVLKRTQEILISRNEKYEEYLEQKEKEKQVPLQKNVLEKMSAAKSNIDNSKSDKLTDLSTVVSQINATLKVYRKNIFCFYFAMYFFCVTWADIRVFSKPNNAPFFIPKKKMFVLLKDEKTQFRTFN